MAMMVWRGVFAVLMLSVAVLSAHTATRAAQPLNLPAHAELALR
jgi:hypothetical protein